MQAPRARKDAHGTAPNAAQFGALTCPPTAPELLLRENGDFGRSPIYAQLSHTRATTWGQWTKSTIGSREIER
jgi:hypothetical protein